ncbi:MAG: hypothetical protein F6K47_04170 [Symploca sp. SIO2E6]|nr:hypothetical protein [Symploca sp. SIO2E6]
MLTPKETTAACQKLAERFGCDYLELMEKLDDLSLPEAIVLNQTTQLQINQAALNSQKSHQN